MSTTTPPGTPPTAPPRAADRASRSDPWAVGLALFAGVMLVLAGVSHVLAGIAGIVGDEVYVPVDDYVYGLDLTAWGWTHLAIGVVLLVIGLAVVNGRDWARAAAIGLAAVSVVANFLFVPYYPVWALLVIALDVAVIWALAATWGRDRY